MALLSSILRLLGLQDITQAQENSNDSTAVQPNILMIVAGDLGYNDISSLNSAGIKTPAIDQPAEKGVLFTRFYADSKCAPSRVGLRIFIRQHRDSDHPWFLYHAFLAPHHLFRPLVCQASSRWMGGFILARVNTISAAQNLSLRPVSLSGSRLITPGPLLLDPKTARP